MVERVAIIGIGVIGGSLALAWKERIPGLHVTGYDTPEVLERARKLGIIHRRATSPADAVQEADAVFLAVPLCQIEPLIRLIVSAPEATHIDHRCRLRKATGLSDS